MEVLNQCPPDVKKSDWVARLNALLQEVQEVDVPLDMTKQGLLQAAVHEFCRLSESSSRLAIASSGVYRHEDDGEKQWWFTGRDVVIFIQEFKKMRTIKEAEVFTELKEMGAANISKYIDKSVGNKKIWVLDIEELNEETILNKDFKIKEESKPWEE
tara:strand:- start:192 stop:662 length:471 start_codon:yes stop_codon:yes gene_type:complete